MKIIIFQGREFILMNKMLIENIILLKKYLINFLNKSKNK